MDIRDLDIIENIDILFSYDIVVWGAGAEGYQLVNFLRESVGLKPKYICDRDKKKWDKEMEGILICSALESREDLVNAIIIISSSKYIDEMYNDIIQLGRMPKGIYSYMAVWFAVTLNLNDVRVMPFYRELYSISSYYAAKKIWDDMTYYTPLQKAKNLTARGNTVLVFQPGKVGSNTVYRGLLEAGVNAIHLHAFSECLKIYKKYVQEQLDSVKIITIVREPIQRDISDFMQYFAWDYLMLDRMHLESMDAHIEERLIESLRNQCNTGSGFEFDWFDSELKGLTGIDVFQYPFDRDKGYTIISEGKYQILLLTLEKLNANSGVIGQFCGAHDFHISNANVGGKKRYRYLYANLTERIKIPKDIIEKYYQNNKYVDYFYDSEMKKEFLERYE